MVIMTVPMAPVTSRLMVVCLTSLILEDKEIERFTVVGVAKETFANDADIREKLGATGIARSFAALKKEVKEYYEGN